MAKTLVLPTFSRHVYHVFGIRSPSLAIIDAAKRMRRDEASMQHTVHAPPWYAARSACDPWSSARMERSARLLRRAIRRRQPAIIKLFWKYMGVDDGAFNIEMARAQIVVRQCTAESNVPLGEAIRAGFAESFRATTRRP
jgi:hypothetical protein